MDLTDRQREILEFVNTHVDAQGYPPTVREIGQAVGLTSPSTVHAHLAKLEAAGLIRRDATKPRALEVIEGGKGRPRSPHPSPHSTTIDAPPARWRGRCWRPIVAEERIEDYVSIPDQLTADADFILTVRGESMINAGIFPGDFVVVRKQQDASNGEIVVALVDEEGATVKRFFRESGRIRLQPENDAMEATYPDEVAILGSVKAVMRRL